MRKLEKFVDYVESFSNFEGEKVKGLHLALNPAKALFLSYRVDSEHGSVNSPFWLSRKPDDLRKIAKAINELADELDGSPY